MAMTKNINGVDIELTPEEEAEVLAMWEANKPPEPTLDDLKAAKLSDINTAFEQEAKALTAGYPESERLTWPVQQAEALAFIADVSAPTPYLDMLAASRGISPAEMRGRTIEQTQLFLWASAEMVGKRQRLRDEVYKAQTPENLAVINWVDPEPEPEIPPEDPPVEDPDPEEPI